MTPEQMAERLAEWARECTNAESSADCPGCMRTHRVDCVEPEGERRTWALWEGGRQVGLVRLRCGADYDAPVRRVALRVYGEDIAEWTIEASDRTRQLLGLDDSPEPGQTGGEG